MYKYFQWWVEYFSKTLRLYYVRLRERCCCYKETVSILAQCSSLSVSLFGRLSIAEYFDASRKQRVHTEGCRKSSIAVMVSDQCGKGLRLWPL